MAMKVTTKSIQSFCIVFASTLTFVGYYIALIILAKLNMSEHSRLLTIPVRGLIITSLLICFLIRRRAKFPRGSKPFLFFSALYLFRIALEYVDVKGNFHRSVPEFFFYFTSFTLIPFLIVSQLDLNMQDFRRIFKHLAFGFFLFSLITLIFYGDLIGAVSRISLAIKKGESYISPLALSYCASLGIGICLSHILTNQCKTSTKFLIILTIGICFVPFLLGSSRGSVLALGIPFIIYLLFSGRTKKKVIIAFSLVLFTLGSIYATNYFQSSVFERLTSIDDDIKSGSSSAVRVDIWANSFRQFWADPFFGNSLESDYANNHPHNVLIEVLITTGIIGFLPFCFFLIAVTRKCLLILKFCPKFSWVTIIFFQAFIQNMFSGGIYGASWLAFGAAMVLSFPLSAHNYEYFNYPA